MRYKIFIEATGRCSKEFWRKTEKEHMEDKLMEQGIENPKVFLKDVHITTEAILEKERDLLILNIEDMFKRGK